MSKKRFYLILIVLLIGFFSTNEISASPEITALKDTAKLLKKEYAHLAPAVGCLWYQASIIENMYRFGNSNEKERKQSAPIFLIKKLFYLNNDGINFNPMQRTSETATHITPHVVGQIIGTIEKFFPASKEYDEKKEQKQEASFLEQTEEFKKTVSIIITDSIIKEIKKIEENEKPLKDRIKYRREEIDNLKKTRMYLNEIKEWESKEKEITKAREKLPSSKGKDKHILEAFVKTLSQIQDDKKNQEAVASFITAALDKNEKEIKTLEEQTKKSKRALEHLKEAKKEQKVANLASLLWQAVSASDDTLYLRNTTQAILLAFMWAKSYTKQDLFDYYQGLQTASPETFLSTDDYKSIAEHIYTEDDYKKLAARFKENPTEIFNNQDDAAFVYFGYQLYEYPFPPQLNYRNDVEYKNIVFPDCGETSVLNFFNLTLGKYVKTLKNGKGDVSALQELLKNSSEKPSEAVLSDQQKKLLQFYINHPNPKDHPHVPTIHNEWATVVSEVNGVAYAQEGICEISPQQDQELGFENIETLIKQLTGYTLEILLKKTCPTITDYYKETREDKALKQIIFSLNQDNLSWRFKWLFYPQHFEFYLPEGTIQVDNKKIQNSLKKIRIAHENPSTTTWISLFTNPQVLTQVHEDFKFSTAHMHHFLFVQKLKNHNAALTLIEQLFTSNLFKQSLKEQLILSLYNHLPLNDEHIINRANKIFLKHDDGIKIILDYKTHHMSTAAVVSFIASAMELPDTEKAIDFLDNLEFPHIESKEPTPYLLQVQLANFINTVIQYSHDVHYYETPKIGHFFSQALSRINIFPLLIKALNNLEYNQQPFIHVVLAALRNFASFFNREIHETDDQKKQLSSPQFKKLITQFFLLIYMTETQEYFNEWIQLIIKPEIIDSQTLVNNKNLIEKLDSESQIFFLELLTNKIDSDIKNAQEIKQETSLKIQKHIMNLIILVFKTDTYTDFAKWINEKIDHSDLKLSELVEIVSNDFSSQEGELFTQTTRYLQKQVEKYRELKQEIPQKMKNNITFLIKKIKDKKWLDVFAQWIQEMEKFTYDAQFPEQRAF